MSFSYRHTEMSIASGSTWINALLSHVPDAHALVVTVASTPIASRKNREFVVAHALHELRYATLLVDALSGYEESRDPDARFDVPRLAARLMSAIDWVRHQPGLGHLPLALLGSNTAAAAVIKIAMQLDPLPFALVTRAGRIDLAGAAPLRHTLLPVLVVSGGDSDETRGPSELAFELLGGHKEKLDIANAGGQFHDTESLDQFCCAMRAFFETWLQEIHNQDKTTDANKDMVPHS